MACYTVMVCDCCGQEWVPTSGKGFDEKRIDAASWHFVSSGGSLGHVASCQFSGVLCWSCRSAIVAAIQAAVEKRTAK